MTGRRQRIRHIASAVAALAMLLLMIAAVRFAWIRPRFDPDRIARSETRMWRAYYARNQAALMIHLTDLLRVQFGLRLPDALRVGGSVARSALTFRSRGHASREDVLPVLEDFYRNIRIVSGAGFDPAEAARAELAWWVARRTPGENRPEQVGRKIAELYAVLYGRQHPAFEEAGHLRAQAASLRDAQGSATDWKRVEELLRQSYRQMADVVEEYLETQRSAPRT